MGSESEGAVAAAASNRRTDLDWRVSKRGVGGGSGLERLDVHFARQRGHVQVKWYRELSSDRRKGVGKMESM